jgi:hypothetical protein
MRRVVHVVCRIRKRVKKIRAIVVLLAVALAGWSGALPAQSVTAPAGAASAAGSQTNAPGEVHRAYVLGTNGTLYLALPAGWKDSIKAVQGVGGLHDAIIFTPADTNEFNFMIVAFSTTGQHAGADMMESSLLQSGQRELTNSVETSVTIRDLKGGAATGAYFRVTDRHLAATKPAAGDFKYLTRGFVVIEPLVLTFDLFSNDANRDEPVALQVLRDARFGP